MAMGYLDEFEAALGRAASRRRPPRLRRPVVALAALLVVAVGVVGLLTVVGGQPASASTIAVRIEAEKMFIRVVRPDAEPRRIVQDLDDAGVRARIVAAPTGPSRVGRLTSLSARGGGITSAGPTEIRVPVGWSGTIDVAEGARAEPGEQYVAPTDAFAPGEPLRCLPASKVSVTQVEGVARSRGVAVQWRSVAEYQVVENPPPTSHVISAVAVSDSTVIARFDPDVTSSSVGETACG